MTPWKPWGFVVQQAQNADARKHIHVGWVCIVEGPRRVESAEQNLTKMLAEHMPVLVIITQVFSDKSPEDGSSFRATVQSLLPMARNVMRVRAFPAELDGGYVVPSTGLRELIDLTMELVPEGQRRALTAAQKVDIALKKKQSHLIVAGAATAAATAGAVPIPFADAIVIVPIQVGMLAGITATFGLSLNEGMLTSVVASLVGGAGATVIGRALVGALLKFVPGVGTVVGGVISATTAAVLTTALGETYIATLELLFTRHNGEPPSADEVVQTFKQQYLQRTSG
jgi:uncharacterized protein (DUF697 family)